MLRFVDANFRSRISYRQNNPLHFHCDLWRSSHQHAGFPFCGKIDRLHVSWTVPIKSYSTLLPFSGVARNWLTSTTRYAVPCAIRNCRTIRSPTYSTANRTSSTITSWPSRRSQFLIRRTPNRIEVPCQNGKDKYATDVPKSSS